MKPGNNLTCYQLQSLPCEVIYLHYAMWRHGRLCTHQRTATLRPLQGTVLYDPSLAAPVEIAVKPAVLTPPSNGFHSILVRVDSIVSRTEVEIKVDEDMLARKVGTPLSGHVRCKDQRMPPSQGVGRRDRGRDSMTMEMAMVASDGRVELGP